MALLAQTKELLSFLQKNPAIRSRIAAPPNATLLYAGNFFRPVWMEIEALKRTNTALATKRLLPDVLATIHTPGQAYPNLLVWAKGWTHIVIHISERRSRRLRNLFTFKHLQRDL